MTTLTKEEIAETLGVLRRYESEYRKRGFEYTADSYLPDIAKYEALLRELVAAGD
jgi:hypothetical protein